MFSKALYKQSWKANWVLWTTTTLVSTFVLVIIMFLIGGEGMGKITSSFTETIVYDELSSQYENMSLNYYTLIEDSLYDFDKAFLDSYLDIVEDNPYQEPNAETFEQASLNAYGIISSNLLNKMHEIDETITEGDQKYQELFGAFLYGFGALSLDETYLPNLVSDITEQDYLNLWTDKTRPENLYDIITDNNRIILKENISKDSSINFLVDIATDDAAIDMILVELNHLGITRELYDSFGFDENGLSIIANSAILTYQARIDFEIELHGETLDIYLIKQSLKETITKTILTSLPESLSTMISEMEDQDMYSSTLVSMYYRIVGMLISIIYLILASINLIAGQVDSGSMAYVLSTGTKRSEVTNTQSAFLISSSFFMYLVITIVSLVIFKFATPVQSDMTYSKLIIFGLATFLVSFAFAGINFLTSSIFNRSNQAMAFGGGVTILMLIFTILGIFGSDAMPSMMRMEVLNFFNYLSLISLIDSQAILTGDATFLWKFAILFLIGLISFIVAARIFKRKDLPL